MFLSGCLALLCLGQNPLPTPPEVPQILAPAEPEEIPFSDRTFAIPVHVRAETKDDIAQINLFVSRDRGKSWIRIASVTPETASFRCRAPDDGSYWFTVQVTDKKGKQEPPDITAATVGLKMLINTTTPVEAARPNAGELEIKQLREQIKKLQQRLEQLEGKRPDLRQP